MARKYLICPYCGGDLELSIEYDGCDWNCKKGEDSGFIKHSYNFSESIEKIKDVKIKGNC